MAGTVLTSSRLPDEVEQAEYKKERRRESFLEAAKTVGLGKMRNEHFFKPKVSREGVFRVYRCQRPIYVRNVP